MKYEHKVYATGYLVDESGYKATEGPSYDEFMALMGKPIARAFRPYSRYEDDPNLTGFALAKSNK